MAYTTINSGAAIDGTFVAGADSFFEKVRGNLIACIFSTYPLGGSRQITIAGTGYKDAVDYLDFEVPDAASSGGVFKAIVDLLCEDVTTTITPKIRNITDSSDAVVGSAAASLTWVSQTLTFTPTVGKKYRLMLVKSDNLNDAFAIGFIRRTDA